MRMYAKSAIYYIIFRRECAVACKKTEPERRGHMKTDSFLEIQKETIERIQACKRGELRAPVAEVLTREYCTDNWKACNRVVFQPMEGSDALPNGAPSELTRRRYLRFAEGGPGIIWMEAVAVSMQGRSSPRQMVLCRETLDAFRALVSDMKKAGLHANGFAPIVAIQLTHSGRYAKPNGYPAPGIAYHNPYLEKNGAPADDCILSDDALARLSESYAVGGGLAAMAGIDMIDVKCCHGYLSCELMTARERAGRYGGSDRKSTRLNSSHT